MPYTLILDIVLAALLAATLVYMVRLNRRLDSVRASREEFEALVKRFTAATEQAQANVTAMKAAADGAGKGLQEEIDRAGGLREDLAYLADRANSLADQLEAAIGRARGTATATVTRMPPRDERRTAAAPAGGAGRPAESPATGRGQTLTPGESELLRRLSTLR